MNPQPEPQQPDEFVTIIGADMDEIARAFRDQGLAERQFSIMHKAERHSFTVVNDGRSEPMFDGRRLIAATFARRAGA